MEQAQAALSTYGRRQSFIEKAQAIYGDSNDYSQFVYVDGTTKGTIVCRIHGPFQKDPEHHLHRKQGCKKCSGLAKGAKRTMTKAEFVAKANVVHGVGRYDYSQFRYVRSTAKGRIRCTVHNRWFEQSSAHHLGGHSACEDCILLKSQETQLERYGAEHHSQTAAYTAKVKQTSLERFGVEHHSKTPEFLATMVASNLERHGVEFASQSAGFQERRRQTSEAKYGAPHRNMSHISKASQAILASKEALVEILLTKSIDEAAKFLGLTPSALGKYCQKYEIELSQSTAEDSICAFLRGHGVKITRKNRKLIKPLEIDMLLPDYKIGIEYNSLYWHREAVRSKGYHLEKLRRMTECGYRLITIFEDEWLHKQEIVESRLLNLVGKSTRGKGARQLTIHEIDAKKANRFLERHHLQGVGTGGYVRYGAFDGQKLVAVMTFARPRVSLGRSSGADELLRFTTDGTTYPGIASRLFRTYVQEQQPEQVITYADRRWSDGNLYRQLGFALVHETGPNYWYVGKHRTREHRFNYRKDRIKHLVENGDAKTERQIMLELGRDRIWDCGSFKYEWRR